jgi:hypothetical protein
MRQKGCEDKEYAKVQEGGWVAIVDSALISLVRQVFFLCSRDRYAIY